MLSLLGGASAADLRAVRQSLAGCGGRGARIPARGCQPVGGPPGPPPTAERPDRIADAGPYSSSRAAVSPAGPGIAGPRRRAAPGAPRAGRLLLLRAGPEPGSSALQQPLPSLPCRPPSGPPGGGVSLVLAPPPLPGPPLPLPAPMYVSPRRARPPARPPTYLPAAPEWAAG